MADAYPMFKECWDRQDNKDASHDTEIWNLLVVNHMICKDTTPITGHVLDEAGGRYPGFYALDDMTAQGYGHGV